MFDHLDDPQPPRSGTPQQIGTARQGGRALIRNRRRHRVAAGSAALAATAGVSTIAALGLPRTGAGAAALTATADTSDPATPSPAAVPTSSAPSSAAATESASAPVPSTTTAPPTTPACTHEATRLRTSVEPAGYLPTDPGDAVIAWTNPGGPLTKLVVSVRCAPFAVSDVPAGEGPVREVTVLDTHHWVIGSAGSGHLQEVWNADNGTAVVIDATVQPSVDETTAEQQLSTFGNYLVD